MARPIAPKVVVAGKEIGEQLRMWRKLLRLTLDQVADRAGIARSTLQKIEKGDGGVSFQAILSTMRALGILDEVVRATDPYETEFGRARADLIVSKRVR